MKRLCLLPVLVLLLAGCAPNARTALPDLGESRRIDGLNAAWTLYASYGQPAASTGLREQDGVYLIQSVEDLILLRDLVAQGLEVSPGLRAQYASYRLTADLDLTEASQGENGWTPIGDYTWGGVPNANQLTAFCGRFDGGGHLITGLTIRPQADRRADMFYGLFGCAVDAVIENLRISNCDITGGSTTGAVVGGVFNLWGDEEETLTIRNCHVSGVVRGEDNVGGVAGVSANVENCRFNGTVEGSGQGVGGVAGRAASIRGCRANASVTGHDSVGGVVGNSYRMMNCYAMGAVRGYEEVGGVVGNGTQVSACYSLAEVYGFQSVGGIVGRLGTAYNIEAEPIEGRLHHVIAAGPALHEVEPEGDAGGRSYACYIGRVCGCYSSFPELVKVYSVNDMVGVMTNLLPATYNGTGLSRESLLQAQTWKDILLEDDVDWDSGWRPAIDGYYPQLVWEAGEPIPIV